MLSVIRCIIHVISLAKPKPTSTPKATLHVMEISTCTPIIQPGVSVVSTEIIVAVMIYAIGSLLPDSNSSSGRRLCFSLMPLLLRMENTDDASVDDIVAAISKAKGKVTTLKLPYSWKTPHRARPLNSHVSSTPTVASVMPGPSTGLMSTNLVPMPPANRMTHNAMLPSISAPSVLLNSMPPTPSSPNSIPTARNSSSAGMPSLLLNLSVKILAKNSSEITNSINSTWLYIFFNL